MAAKKVQAIKDFLAGLAELRAQVKADSVAMMAGITLEVLADPKNLAAYLEELTATIAHRHLINDKGKVQPAAARLIKAYVKGMWR